MITLVETDKDGMRREMTFENNREAANMLREMFGDDALQSEAQHIRNQTNAALRSAYKSRELDPSAFFSRGNKTE